MSFEAFAGAENAYRILLGDAVVNEVKQKVGSAGLTKFLQLHSKYDALTRKSPKTDPIHVVHKEIPVFDSAEGYMSFLRGISQQLGIMKEPLAKAMHQCITQMLDILGKQTPKTATASEEAPRIPFSKRVFKRRLPVVPVVDSKSLPRSYPNWEATLDVVSKYANEKGMAQHIFQELTATLKAGLATVVEFESREHRDPDLKSLVAEAQEYLMSRHWLGYGIHDVAYASHGLAVAGIRHRVTTQGCIKHIGLDRTLAYTHIGSSLEAVLRRAIFACVRELVAESSFTGYTPATDVLVSACSKFVQDVARDWLNAMLIQIKDV